MALRHRSVWMVECGAYRNVIAGMAVGTAWCRKDKLRFCMLRVTEALGGPADAG